MSNTTETKKFSDRALFAFMFGYGLRFKKELIGAMLLMAATTILLIIKPAIIGNAIDTFINGYKTPYVQLRADEKGAIPYNGLFYKKANAKTASNKTYGLITYVQKEYYFFQDLAHGDLALLAANNMAEHSTLGQDFIYYRTVSGRLLTGTHLSENDLKLFRGRDFRVIIKYALLYFLILLVSYFTSMFQSKLIGKAGQRILYTIREDIFRHIMQLDAKYFDVTPTGKIVTRITNDTETLNEMYTSVLLNLTKDIFMIAGVIITMFFFNVKLALLIMIAIPAIALVTAVFRKAARSNYTKLRNTISSLNSFLSEAISGIKLIQLLGIEEKKIKEFLGINKEVNSAYLGEIFIYGTFRPIMYFISMLSLITVLFFGGKMVLAGAISIGTLFIFIQYVNLIFEPVMELAEEFNILQSAIAASEKLKNTLAVESTINCPQNPVPLSDGAVQGKIEFKHVWFAYNDENWVLKDVSFVIQPGESFALVGPTGSGKTSIINLLARYYDIQKGEICIDGINIREIDLDILRRHVGVVMQDVFIFAGTFRDNICLFEEGITEEMMKRAAHYVNAEDFITAYQEQYNHYLEEKGMTLSAGQRQLLSFARTIAFDPPIIVLDEATANIDPHTEHLIQEALIKIMGDKTSIVVAHRLSTIQHADRILVLSKGEIKESGTHGELIEKGGLYYELYSHQYL